MKARRPRVVDDAAPWPPMYSRVMVATDCGSVFGGGIKAEMSAAASDSPSASSGEKSCPLSFATRLCITRERDDIVGYWFAP